MKRSLLAALMLAGLTGAGVAQHAPYSGQQSREVKALSADEIKQYLAGAGMGYAKAAELNSFPGPMHALELVERLGLTADQREATRRLMDAHKAEARAIGARLVQAEGDLDALFRSGHVLPDRLRSAVMHVGALQAEYRLTHLETHRRMKALLTEDQVKRYDQERGYGSSSSAPSHSHKH